LRNEAKRKGRHTGKFHFKIFFAGGVAPLVWIDTS
jgi:hypothetical protein